MIVLSWPPKKKFLAKPLPPLKILSCVNLIKKYTLTHDRKEKRKKKKKKMHGRILKWEPKKQH